MFEGSEKKLEVIFSASSPSLFNQPLRFWKKTVYSCGAKIIDSLKLPKIHSYILSESSLFVWDKRLVLITCGKTNLCKSFVKIIKTFPKNSVEMCFFQRKNEFFPRIQKSCFFKDLKEIKKHTPGKAYRFGPLHDHHLFLFHSFSNYKPKPQDETLEILIYDSKNFKNNSTATIANLKQKLKHVFPGFKTHEHFFRPLGYSLNAIKNHLYYTLHITPEKSFFYISFETNIKQKSTLNLSRRIIDIFNPERFDLIFFEPFKRKKKTGFTFPKYFLSYSFHQGLDDTYTVHYINCHNKNIKIKSPVILQ